MCILYEVQFKGTVTSMCTSEDKVLVCVVWVCVCVWPWLFVFFMCIHALCLCVCVLQSTNRESWALQGISCIITERLSEAGWILIEFCGVFHCLWSHSSEIRENFRAWCPSVSHTHSFSFSLPSSLSLRRLFPFCTLPLFSFWTLFSNPFLPLGLLSFS